MGIDSSSRDREHLHSQPREANAAQESGQTAGESCRWGRKKDARKCRLLCVGYAPKDKTGCYTRPRTWSLSGLYSISILYSLSGLAVFSGLYVLRSALRPSPARSHPRLAESWHGLATEPSSSDRKHTIHGCAKPMLRKTPVTSGLHRDHRWKQGGHHEVIRTL